MAAVNKYGMALPAVSADFSTNEGALDCFEMMVIFSEFFES